MDKDSTETSSSGLKEVLRAATTESKTRQSKIGKNSILASYKKRKNKNFEL